MCPFFSLTITISKECSTKKIGKPKFMFGFIFQEVSTVFTLLGLLNKLYDPLRVVTIKIHNNHDRKLFIQCLLCFFFSENACAVSDIRAAVNIDSLLTYVCQLYINEHECEYFKQKHNIDVFPPTRPHDRHKYSSTSTFVNILNIVSPSPFEFPH